MNYSSIITRNHVLSLGASLAAAWGILLLFSGAIPQAVNRFFFVLPPNPYFISGSAGLLYLLVPLVLLASFTVWLLPGVFLMLVIGREARWTSLLPKAFAASLGLYILAISLVKLLIPGTPAPEFFRAAVAVSGVIVWALLAWQVFHAKSLVWPLAEKRELRRLLWTAILPLVLLLVMLPIFLWQDMHDDGFEALEIGRSLSTYLVIRFPNPAGFLGLGVGMLPMAFPIHWMDTLFGSVEAAARFPLLLYLPVVFCLLVELIEWRSERKLGFVEELLLVVGLSIYTLAMSYNASYDVYLADIAAPTALETMTILTILATIYFLWSGQTGWFLLFALLSYLCRPTGLMILGLLGLATYLTFPEYRKRWLVNIAIAILVCLAFAFVYDNLFLPRVAGTSNIGYESTSAFSRIRYIRLNDFSRLNFAIFPSGILPFLSLFFIKWQDRYARMLTLISLIYFFFFFFQGFVAMHHFVPAMILPLVVFWRIYLNEDFKYRQQARTLVAIGAVLAIWLSLPNSFEINRTVRNIGQKISMQIGDYESDYRTQVQHSDLLFKLFSPDWDVKDENRELITGFASLIYYGTRVKKDGADINYIVQPVADPPPDDFTQIASDEGAAVYVKDLGVWNQDRYQALRTDAQSRIYDLPRSTLFFYFFWRQLPENQLVFDVKQVLDWGKGLIRNAVQ